VIDVVPKANRSDVETALTRLLGVEVHLTDSRQGASGERQMKTRTVFVVYGRNLKARAKVFGFLRALGLQPLEWEEAIQLTNTPSPYIGDVIDTGMRHAQAIVVLLTGDDEVRLSPDLTTPADGDEERSTQRQPRANVIFEAGVAVGRYPERTILLQLGAIKLFSDIHGRHLLRMSARPEERNVFVSKLRTAGCEVSTVGNDWLQVDIDV
jgi:predicted nucleotide-binding protein